MVVARQRPETAKGIVFMLLEDERGTINLIVPPPVYDRRRAEVRASPLVRAKGRLERREGTINVLVSEVAELHASAAGPRPRPPPGTGPLRSCERSPPPVTASAAAAEHLSTAHTALNND
jgi:error-prone DNA polymerase